MHQTQQNNGDTVHIDAFTSPGDADCAAGITAAIALALTTGASTVRFAAGVYHLRDSTWHHAPGAVHDADNLGQAPRKQCHLHLRGAQGLTLLGAVDAQGQPATILAGDNDGAEHRPLPAILWAEDCPALTVRNIGFTRIPAYATAGAVVACDSAGVTVAVFAGEPCQDGMGAYCMNRCDPLSGMLRGASVTFGRGAGVTWRQCGEGLLHLPSSTVAAQVALGEHLSWHQGACTDIQTYFGGCAGLHFDNLRIFNANGLALVTEHCRDITADRIVLRPDGRRLFTAPRDGWKLFRCSGRIAITRMEIHGVRMDGQNVHSTWLQRESAEAGNEAIFTARYAFAPLEVGSELKCWLGDQLTRTTIAAWSHAGRSRDGHRYHVRCHEPLPAGPGMLAAPLCWQPDLYTCRDSTFTSIAGAGHLIRGGRVEITGCTYRHLMCPGIHLGAELGTHPEGGHVSDVVIECCRFENCGERDRAFYDRGPGGCIATGTIGDSTPNVGTFIRRVRIRDNHFSSSPLSISLRQTSEVAIERNRFTAVGHEALTG
jgi:hypothetical protein